MAIDAPPKNMTPCESSNIKAHGYVPENLMMFLTFKSGGTYRYPKVAQKQYDGFVAAESKGKHFNAMGIKANGIKI